MSINLATCSLSFLPALLSLESNPLMEKQERTSKWKRTREKKPYVIEKAKFIYEIYAVKNLRLQSFTKENINY